MCYYLINVHVRLNYNETIGDQKLCFNVRMMHLKNYFIHLVLIPLNNILWKFINYI